MIKVTGKQIPKNNKPIFLSVFKDSLTQIELTDYNNSEKSVIEEAIPEGLRKDFNIFT